MKTRLDAAENGILDVVQVVKLDNRSLLYSAGDAPAAFFDAEGRGESCSQLYGTIEKHSLRRILCSVAKRQGLGSQQLLN